MSKDLQDLPRRAAEEAEASQSEEDLQIVKTRYLGRKGILTQHLKRMRNLPPEDRPALGKAVHAVEAEVEAVIQRRLEALRRRALEQGDPSFDVTLPGRSRPAGRLHPVYQVMDEVLRTFQRLGYDIAEGPEVETDYYNFEALNIPADHPARDMHDTFYLTETTLLRTHTSPVQIRVMEKQEPPVKIVAPGKVYRCDADVSHSPMFHQVEGLLVDRNVTFADLRGTLSFFLRATFGPDVGVRFRPSFFPFTEPSAEVDIRCVICGGRGCRVCGSSGWLEILGAGIVDPAVYGFVGYDPEEVTGFAFGLGVERVAMLKYGIDDIRLFFDNDIRFLSQF
ncbi:MAG: phenylalanine--tRNA ligase subunit alpha [Nitrospinota bacterium]